FFGGADGHIGKFDLVWALKNKKLAFPKYLVLLDDLDQDKIDQLESGLSLSDIDKLLFLHKKDHEIVRLINKTVTEQGIEDVKGIIFCRNIQHMNHLIAFFEPGTATLVHSKMYDQERRENIRLFREGDYKYILVCDLFNEGIDIPETNLLIFMRYTGSRTIWLQQLGRGLRKTPNKEFVHVLDFVGSLERLNEIKSLAKEIEQQPRYHDSTIDDPEEMDAPEVYHDTSLEVQFSAEAAKVLALLEEMKMQLNSRDVLLDKLRRYREKNDELPSIAELEQELDDVSLDQIATHFGSYLSYLTAAFNEDVDIPSMRTRLIEFLDTFVGKNNMAPSFYTISLNFGVNPLYEFSEKEIQQLLPDYDNLVSARIKVTAPQDVSDMPVKEVEVCPWIETYRGQPLNLVRFKQLPSDVQEQIKNKYQSAFVFLKKLKDAL
ncbi:TPA: restriction endonuclease, partial [Escherichia coli]|nr:restriction endonuclease [Escherichia coli]